MAEEPKGSTLTVQVTPLTKVKAMRRALKEGKSLDDYIAWLIERDDQAANQTSKPR
jgi:hypothetical protein